MAQYGNFNFNRKNKHRKIIIIAVCAAAALAVAVYIIGLIVSVGGARAERITSAVAENVRLKEQVSALSERVAYLEQENEELNARLALVPEPEPSPYSTPTEEPSPTPNALPRGDR